MTMTTTTTTTTTTMTTTTMRTLHSSIDSKWTPSGLHMELWSPCGLHVTLCGLCVDHIKSMDSIQYLIVKNLILLYMHLGLGLWFILGYGANIYLCVLLRCNVAHSYNSKICLNSIYSCIPCGEKCQIKYIQESKVNMACGKT